MYSWDLKELLVLAFTLHYLDCDGLGEQSFSETDEKKNIESKFKPQVIQEAVINLAECTTRITKERLHNRKRKNPQLELTSWRKVHPFGGFECSFTLSATSVLTGWIE